MGKKDDKVKTTTSPTPPILGGLLGVKSRVKATDGKNSAWGNSKTEARNKLKKKDKSGR